MDLDPRALARLFDEEAEDDDTDGRDDDVEEEEEDRGIDILSGDNVSGDEDFNHGVFDAQRAGYDRAYDDDSEQQRREGILRTILPLI